MGGSSPQSQPSQPSRPRSPELLALRVAAGLASPEELRHARSQWRFVGGDAPGSGALALPPVCETTDEWLARYGGPQKHLAAPPDLRAMHDVSDRAPRPERPSHTDVGGGIVLAHPEHEPPPAGKPGYRGARGARWSRG